MDKFDFKFTKATAKVKTSDLESIYQVLQTAKSLSTNCGIKTQLHCALGYLWTILEANEK